MILRPYQGDAVRAALRDLRERGDALLVLPTGAGKTVIAGSIIDAEFRDDPRSRFLVVQHREELLQQNREAMASIAGVDSSIVAGSRNGWDGTAVFASAQTLQRPERLIEAPPFSHIILDEAHHAMAPSWRRIIDHVRGQRPDVRILGMTATPERADGAGLGGLFPRASFTVPMRQLVEEGHLVEPICRSVDLADAELAGVRANDLGEIDEAGRILNRAVHNDAVVDNWRQHAAGRPTVAFCCTIEHAAAVATAFNAAGISAALVSSNTRSPERAAVLRRLDAGEISVVTNCTLLTEGFDSQPVACIIILRPMLHQSTFVQAVGRGLRKVDTRRFPGVVKSDCVILDFAGAAARHGSLEVMLGLRSRAAKTGEAVHEGRQAEASISEAEIASDIRMRVVKLLRRSPFAWENVHGDLVAAGFDAVAVVHPRDDGFHVAVGVIRDGSRAVRLAVGTQAQAIASADDFMRAHESSDSAKKARRWLHEPASEKQLALLAKSQNRPAWPHGYPIPTKYKASCAIAAKLLHRRAIAVVIR